MSGSRDPFRKTLQSVTNIKPLDSIERLQRAFLKSASKVLPHQLESSIKREDNIYILTRGYYWLYRKPDKLRLFTVKAPHIFGLADLLIPTVGEIYMNFSPGSEVYTLPYADTQQVLSQAPGLWKDVAILLSFHLHYSYWRDLHLLNDSAYDTIKGKLLELEMNTDEFREKNSIVNYILSTTKISRSTIMKITKDLIAGGYITANRGHLININHLPQRY